MPEIVQSIRHQEIEFQVGFYRDIVLKNPLIDPMLFLFIEKYPEVAMAIRDAEVNDRELSLDIHIQQTELEKFFSDLGRIGIYGCGPNFVYYLRERLVKAKENIRPDDWEIIMKYIFNNPLVIAQAKRRLLLIKKNKEEELMGIIGAK